MYNQHSTLNKLKLHRKIKGTGPIFSGILEVNEAWGALASHLSHSKNYRVLH